MNMMTRMYPPRVDHMRRPMAVPQLLAHVDRALALSSTPASRFGDAAVGDKGVLRRLRSGASNPRRKLRLAIEDHADRLIAEARERAFATLIAFDGKRGVGAVVESLIDMLDRRDGDPDLEDNGDFELTGDEHGDFALIEWNGRLQATPAGNEDAEEDDAAEDDDHAGGNPEDTGECMAWPERHEADDTGAGGLGGLALDWGGDINEDDEPRHVPASMDRLAAANAS